MKKSILLIFVAIMCCMAFDAKAQTSICVTGMVVEYVGGTPPGNYAVIPGVNVTLKGTTSAVVTTFQGAFIFWVPSSTSVLVFSFLGYKTKEIIVGTQTEINVIMEPDDEIV